MIRVAVLHEPLIGPAGGAVHCFVQRAARHLAACPQGPVSRRAAVEFVTRLVGADSWAALGADGRAAVADRTAVIRAEVPRFAAFEAGTVPDDGAVSVVVTVGERSPDMRHEAAARAAELLHGRMAVIPGVGHLPQLEAPDAFAELIGSTT
jgi:pimeloyl-ACP methyl ester carboxylesterase